jgi:hypothetical protein
MKFINTTKLCELTISSFFVSPQLKLLPSSTQLFYISKAHKVLFISLLEAIVHLILHPLVYQQHQTLAHIA